MIFISSKKTRGKYPIGVHKVNNRYSASISKKGKGVHLGYFATVEEAFNAYKYAKESYIKEVADKWKDQIEPRVYEAMYNWKVEITD